MTLPNMTPATGLTVARICLALMFGESVINHLTNYPDVLADAISAGLPFASLSLPLSLIAETMGIFALLSGKWLKEATAVLAVFVIASTFLFFPFWLFEGVEATVARQNFVKNLSIVGNLILVYALSMNAIPADIHRQGAKQ